jgi:hypothetical protein
MTEVACRADTRPQEMFNIYLLKTHLVVSSDDSRIELRHGNAKKRPRLRIAASGRVCLKSFLFLLLAGGEGKLSVPHGLYIPRN